MSSEILPGRTEPRPGFRVAVLGTAAWADADTVERLIRHLVARLFDTHQITLVVAGTRRGQCDVVSLTDWRFELVPSFGGLARQDRELCDWCDAALVLGNPEPWRNLLRLFAGAGKPTRLHTGKPRLSVAPRDPLGGL